MLKWSKIAHIYVHDITTFPSLLVVAQRASLLQRQGSLKAAVGLLDVAVAASSNDPSLHMFRAALKEEVILDSTCVHLCVW